MSATKRAIEFGTEINAMQEFYEDDLNEITDRLICDEFVTWAIKEHKTYVAEKLKIDPADIKYVTDMAYDFAFQMDIEQDIVEDYIAAAIVMFRYYLQAYKSKHAASLRPRDLKDLAVFNKPTLRAELAPPVNA